MEGHPGGCPLGRTPVASLPTPPGTQVIVVVVPRGRRCRATIAGLVHVARTRQRGLDLLVPVEPPGADGAGDAAPGTTVGEVAMSIPSSLGTPLQTVLYPATDDSATSQPPRDRLIPRHVSPFLSVRTAADQKGSLRVGILGC